MSRQTIAVSVKASKLTARALAYVVAAVGRKIAKEHRKAQTPHGKQSVRKLMGHGGDTNAIEVDTPKLFDKVARKWGVDYAIRRVGDAEQKLKGFSGGMLRRVGIAQTLLCNPQILLLDEPTAGLDPQERVRLRNLLSALAQHSIIILSTHIVSDVELIAEKIILLREGQIAAFDTVAGLVGKSTLEDVYLTYFQKEA